MANMTVITDIGPVPAILDMESALAFSLWLVDPVLDTGLRTELRA